MSIYNIIVEFTFYYTQIFISELFFIQMLSCRRSLFYKLPYVLHIKLNIAYNFNMFYNTFKVIIFFQ